MRRGQPDEVASGAYDRFLETFVLRLFLPDYKPFREEFRRLFNSYYNSIGDEAPEKHLRAVFSRPSLDDVIAFRTHVDAGMERLLAGRVPDDAVRRIVLGLNHEQQHQELMFTDIKHAFFSNPLRPAHYGNLACSRIGFLARLDDFLYLPEVLYVLILLWLIFSGPGRYSVDGIIASGIVLFGVER